MASKTNADDKDSFTCAICKDVYRNPVKISCGHSFCQECVEQTWEIKEGDPTCPICRKSVDGKKITDMAMMGNMSNKFTKCENCRKRLTFMEYRRHQKICNGGISSSWAPGNSERHFAADVEGSHGNIYTFACPHCDTKNLDRESLLKHVNQNHHGEKKQVVCPICKAMPWGNPEQLSQNFSEHINIRHKFDYDRFVDFNLDDETALQTTINKSTKQY